MSFDGFIGLRNKDELMEDYYNFHVESLKKYSPLSERDLYPFVYDGVDAFKYDLSICLLNDIKLKGKRNIIKNHKNDITDNIELIKNELYNYYVGNIQQIEIYCRINDKDWGVDGDWYNIMNNYCKEKYGFYFIDYDILKIHVNDSLKASCNVDNACYWLAKKVNVNKKFDTWQKVLEFK